MRRRSKKLKARRAAVEAALKRTAGVDAESREYVMILVDLAIEESAVDAISSFARDLENAAPSRKRKGGAP